MRSRMESDERINLDIWRRFIGGMELQISGGEIGWDRDLRDLRRVMRGLLII